MNNFRLVLATSCALFATAAHAQDQALGEGTPASRSAKAAPAATAKQSFTTGVAKGRDLLDSAISASSIDEEQIQKIGTRSIAEVLANIPGIRAETAGTDGLTAITIRGLPMAADGSKFLQIQEDGLPVLEFGDIHFAATTAFLRTDLSLSQVQAIRGGSASTFASNSPGGLVNFISKTGEEEGGTIQLSSGIDHELGRVDFNYGGHLSKTVRFNVGGFYRQGEGPRATGFDAFKGGQIKLNVTKTFENGYVRVYGKYLDDREPNYAMMPVAVRGTNADPVYSTIAGFDPRKDTLDSRFKSSILALDGNNNVTNLNLLDGNRSKVASLGLEAQFDIAGWTFSNRMRYASISGSYNESSSLALLPAVAVAPTLGGPGATLRYATGPKSGQTITNLASLNGNGLMMYGLAIHSDLDKLDNFTNDFRGSRVWNVGEGKLTTTAGFYASSQALWQNLNLMTNVFDIAPNGGSAYVDVVTATGTSVTQGGVVNYGISGGSAYRRRYDLDYRVFAPYGSINYQIGALSVGASMRYDFGKVSGTLYGADLGGGRMGTAPVDMNRDGTIAPAERAVAVLPLSRPGVADYSYKYASYSVGVNYRVAEPLSVFARYSRGGRATAERLFFSPAVNPASGALTDPAMAYGPVKQAEGGVKFRKDGVTLFATGFWASTQDKNLQIGANATGNTVVLQIDRDYSAKGVEVEGLFEQGPFGLRLGATYTKATIDADKADKTLVGNTPRHQPDLIFQATPQFEVKHFTIGTNVLGTTSSFAQDNNVLKQPGYAIVSPFVQVRPVDGIQIGLNVFNVFDKLAFVSVNSAAIPASGIVTAQTLTGRTVTASVRFSF
ncbi:TonB-dependent receptor domain-containing protein [Sphingomonas sp. HT-1]|uniref:TonB-dependent receptor domain-containing protein n=1 Tax=unclassified Sphingomonas TaxID=196159 RepID=UPI0002D6FF7A|nr:MULTISPECIES: TonB-dependent receptor [unclassified Sphingomonas]KTF69066.1 TonB-dependent receptor [Sphingomonas sp. WG]